MSAYLLAAGLLFGLACAPSQDAAAADDSPQPIATADQPLLPHELARVGDESLGLELFQRYLAMVYARLPEGERAVQQLLLEALVESRAAALGVSVGEAEVDALAADLDRRAREASGDDSGLAEQFELDDAMRDALRLAALQRAVVAAERRVAPQSVSDAELSAWIQTALDDAQVQEQPLTDALAVTFEGGALERVAVGRRLADLLPSDEVSGVLTELIGIRAIEQRAQAMGVDFTAEQAAAELAERERLLAIHPTTAGVSYTEYLAQVHQRTPAEIVASPKFKAEVLLRLMVEATWDEPRLVELFEQERPAFEARYGPGVDYASARPGVLKEVRQRTYRELLAGSRIVRRF